MGVQQVMYRFGPVQLAEGIRPRNAAAFLLAALVGVCLTTFISTIQPYVLTVNIGLPVAEQGRVSGTLRRSIGLCFDRKRTACSEQAAAASEIWLGGL